MPSIPGRPETILVAPDSFKETFSATEVAGAIADGLRAAGSDVDCCPIADGGEGTLEALTATLGVELHRAEVSDPLGRPISACFGLVSAAGRRGRSTAVLETAAASGLGLVAERERDAIAADTFGTGQLIVAALAAGAQTVLLGVGGSASTDGGAGALRAIKQGGGLRGARLVVLCDVRTAFEDAPRVFGPQKGADEAGVRQLTKRLNTLAGRLPRDPRGIPMTGAAGGLGGGLWAERGAELVGGASYILDAIDFDRRMRGARAVVTGEGKLDEQSLAGKAVSEVATRARQSGVPCYGVVGRLELDAFGTRILDLQVVLEARTLPELRSAGRELARLIWD